MRSTIALSGIAVGGIAVLLGQMNATAVPGNRGNRNTGFIGQDVVVGSIPSVARWSSSGGLTSYSMATTSCNIGDEVLTWQANNNNHPVIPQSLWRLHDCRVEEIGKSWSKHGFCALQQNLCGSCSPAGGGCPAALGVGCSDPYSASLNGDQGGLGPRWETNAWTGFFEYPFDNPSYSGGLARRLVVDNDDLASSSYPGAVYYAAACYVHPEDAEDNNHWNNHSIRKVDVGNFSSGGYNISLTGSTRIGQTPPEILIYEDVDSALVRDVDIPDEGRFTVGMTCCDNGDGTWTYNYMIFNVNSHLSCSGLEIPLGSGVTATDMNFSDADYHSGEPYDNEDWDMNVLSNSVFWSSPKESENPNANAIRWHSMHTFWFTADSPPATGDVILDLHRDHPDGIDAITFKGYIPSDLSEPCIGDINGDQIVDGTDLGFLLGAWGVTPPPWGDFDGNNIVDGVDLGVLLGNWGFCR